MKARKSIQLSLRLGLILLVVICTGCGIKPWVKPYERANLADPIMSFTRNPVSDAYVNHVYAARYGSRGAESGHGGGCGCN